MRLPRVYVTGFESSLENDGLTTDFYAQVEVITKDDCYQVIESFTLTHVRSQCSRRLSLSADIMLFSVARLNTTKQVGAVSHRLLNDFVQWGVSGEVDVQADEHEEVRIVAAGVVHDEKMLLYSTEAVANLEKESTVIETALVWRGKVIANSTSIVEW